MRRQACVTKLHLPSFNSSMKCTDNSSTTNLMSILCSLFCCSSAKTVSLLSVWVKGKNAQCIYDFWACKCELPRRTWSQQKLSVCKQDWIESGVDVPQRRNEGWRGWDKEDEANVFWQRVIQEVDEREKEEGVGRMIRMVQIWRAEQTSYGWHWEISCPSVYSTVLSWRGTNYKKPAQIYAVIVSMNPSINSV